MCTCVRPTNHGAFPSSGSFCALAGGAGPGPAATLVLQLSVLALGLQLAFFRAAACAPRARAWGQPCLLRGGAPCLPKSGAQPAAESCLSSVRARGTKGMTAPRRASVISPAPSSPKRALPCLEEGASSISWAMIIGS